MPSSQGIMNRAAWYAINNRGCVMRPFVADSKAGLAGMDDEPSGYYLPRHQHWPCYCYWHGASIRDI